MSDKIPSEFCIKLTELKRKYAMQEFEINTLLKAAIIDTNIRTKSLVERLKIGIKDLTLIEITSEIVNCKCHVYAGKGLKRIRDLGGIT